jgi:hypothetical protein
MKMRLLEDAVKAGAGRPASRDIVFWDR